MSLLTDKEILEMAHDGVFLQSIYEITRDIEAMIIEKIKAQGLAAFRVDEVHFVDVERTARNATDLYGWEPLYRLPEGD